MGRAPEAYSSQFVCVCVTLQLGFLEARDKQYLKAKGHRFLIYKALFSSYNYATGQAATQVKTQKLDHRRLADICLYTIQ